MKNLIYLLIFSVLFILSCNDDDWDLSIDSFIADNYSAEALDLYLQEIQSDNNHPNRDKAQIEQLEVDRILQIIQAVYNLNSPQTDSVFNVHIIRSGHCISYNRINILVDTSDVAIQNLIQEQFPTGNDILDNIIDTYEFNQVEERFYYQNFQWLTILTNNQYNLIPVFQQINQVQPIVVAEYSQSCFTDGDRIYLDRSNDAKKITFSLGMGDCPSGCFYHINWEFEVEDGQAKFIKRYID